MKTLNYKELTRKEAFDLVNDKNVIHDLHDYSEIDFESDLTRYYLIKGRFTYNQINSTLEHGHSFILGMKNWYNNYCYCVVDCGKVNLFPIQFCSAFIKKSDVEHARKNNEEALVIVARDIECHDKYSTISRRKKIIAQIELDEQKFLRKERIKKFKAQRDHERYAKINKKKDLYNAESLRKYALDYFHSECEKMNTAKEIESFIERYAIYGDLTSLLKSIDRLKDYVEYHDSTGLESEYNKIKRDIDAYFISTFKEKTVNDWQRSRYYATR